MKTIPELLAPIKERLENATPGPLCEREDLDYYQGGTYLGVNAYKYDKSGKYPVSNELTGSEFTGYFETDVCRVESSQDKELLKHASADIAKLIRAVECLSEGLHAGMSISNDYDAFNEMKDALAKAEEILR